MPPPRPDGLPRIGLALIARNEERNLPHLLASLGWERREERWREDAAVDYIVLADTGSTDDTVELARSYGIDVVEHRWTDDFSAARQASFDALPEGLDFHLWADCDDVIRDAEQLRAIAARLPPGAAATMHRYDYGHDDAGNVICVLWRERLLRAGVGRWVLPVHEVYELPPATLLRCDDVVWVHHHPEERERDPERNRRILQREYDRARKAGEPADPRTVAYLGTELMTLGRWAEAAEVLREYLALPTATMDEERCQVSHKLSLCHRQMDDLDGSADYALRAIAERPDWPDGFIDLAELALRREQPAAAVRFAERAIATERPPTLLITNPLEDNYHPRLIRAVALAKLGRLEESFAETRELLAITPSRPDLQTQAASLAGALRQAEAKQHLLALREVLVRHDENDKARRLMAECVPYIVTADPEVWQARLDQREMTLHATDPATYRRYYRDNPNEAPFERQGVEIAEAHEHFHRVKFLRRCLDELAEQRGVDVAELRVLDLTANDGWMLANLAAGGYGVKGSLHGMELNADASARARERAELATEELALGDGYGTSRFEIVTDDLHNAAEHFVTESYDAVVLFETIEHVPVPRETLSTIARMASEDGLVVVSTPAGAYEQGNLPDWARVESKGHLHALRAIDVAALACEQGVIAEMEVEQRLAVVAIRPRPRRGRVVIYGGPVDARPELVLTEGLGGSETAICYLAEHLARDGFDVRVYAGTEATGQGPGPRGDHLLSEDERPPSGQVLYLPFAEYDPGEPADLFVSCRDPAILDRSIAAERSVLWLHDHDYGDALTPARLARVDDVVVLSQFHRQVLAGRYPGLGQKAWLSRNGIATRLYAELEPWAKRRPRVVYTSSPDRGLDVLLELWPQIRARVPDAELHHAYAPVYHRFRAMRPDLQAFHERIEQLQRDAGEGVVAHEPLSQPDVAELFRSARVWAYPSWHTPSASPFPEISCISAMEAQAAGCWPVCLDYGALPETVPLDEARVMLRTVDRRVGCLGPSTRAAFVDAVVKRLQGDAPPPELRDRALELDWAGVAAGWVERFLTSEPAAKVSA